MIRPVDLAQDLARVARRLQAEGDQAITHARNCRPGVSSASTDGIRSHTRSDPTASQALDSRPDPAAALYGAITGALLDAHKAMHALDDALDKCTPTRTDRQTAIDLVDANTRSGQCEICVDAGVATPHHSGRRGDRLRAIITHDRDTPTTLVCAACRKAWERRPYSGHADGRLQPYTEWRRDRVAHLTSRSA